MNRPTLRYLLCTAATRFRAAAVPCLLVSALASCAPSTSSDGFQWEQLISAGGSPGSADENARLLESLKTLDDAAASPGSRQRAAEAAVASDHPAAQDAITRILTLSDPTTQQFVLQALASTPRRPSPKLVKPLLRLLSRIDEAYFNDIAAALSRFDDPALVRRLTRAAWARSADATRRRGAIIALGHHRIKAAAKALVALLDPKQPAPVRAAAQAALSRLTGLDPLDRQQWQQWWDTHRDLSEHQWQKIIIQNLARYNEQLTQRNRLATARLTDAQRQLYRTTPQEDRQTLLVAMAQDTVDTTRRLAIDLCFQRLIDNQPIDSQLRAAMIARLDDPVSINRYRAALLLRDLADAPAADAVAQRLITGVERDPLVLGAYLRLITKMPRADAVAFALDHLTDPVLGGDAAGALAASANKGLLDTDQATHAATQVRQVLKQKGVPDPKSIELLGRVGSDEDWQRIANWIDSDDPAIKQAAAQAWADSQRPLHVLHKHAGDPVVRQIFIATARRRGFEPQTLMTLIENKPQQDQVVLAWDRAIVAVAQRVPPAAVLDADRALVQQQASPQLRDQIFSAIIDRLLPQQGGDQPVVNSQPDQPDTPSPAPIAEPDDPDLPVLIDLILARAEIRQAINSASQALPDYQLLEPMTPAMTPQQHSRYQLGMLDAKLAAGELDEAITLAQDVIDSHAASIGMVAVGDRVFELLWSAAQRSVAAGQSDRARQLLTALRNLAGPTGSPSYKDRIDQLERGLAPQPTQQAAPDPDSQPPPDQSTPPPDQSTPPDQSPSIPDAAVDSDQDEPSP